jgi:hypothetical protein
VEASATAEHGLAEHYDSFRDLYYAKPRMRGWAHLICFEIALVIGTLTIVDAHGARETSVAAIYAAAVAGLFGASALYHRGKWGPRALRRLQRLDHLMIILLIAGTATPAVVLSMHGTAQVAELVLLWSFATATAIARLMWMSAPEKIALHRSGLDRRCRRPRRVDPQRHRSRCAVARRRTALHGRRRDVPPPASGPPAPRVRLPRGLPHLRQPRGRVSVRRDRVLRALTARGQNVRSSGSPLAPRGPGLTASTWLTPMRFAANASAEPAM